MILKNVFTLYENVYERQKQIDPIIIQPPMVRLKSVLNRKMWSGEQRAEGREARKLGSQEAGSAYKVGSKE
jgi:hypothetical protein